MIINTDISHLIKLAREYYRIPDNECGGVFHIVLDDENTSKSSIRFCLKLAKKSNDAKGIELGEILLNTPLRARNQLVKKHYSAYCHQ